MISRPSSILECTREATIYPKDREKPVCKAVRQEEPLLENPDWDGGLWKNAPSQKLDHHMGTRPDHFPRAEVKIIYNRAAVCLMFQVADRYVRAAAQMDQDDVYKDSCVEFFFTPGPDQGYFNLEMNCGGTMLFHYQVHPRKDPIVIPEDECQKITRVHSLPRIVDPEIKGPVTWTLAYRIPVAVLERYCRVTPPEPGACWQVNFYKCGDDTSHPHWLTWSPVDFPTPDFHRPQSFGQLHFQ